MRTKKQITRDYQRFLESTTGKVFTEEESIRLLMEKLYSVQEHNGALVSSVEAWWHFINFVVKEDPVTHQKIWNRFVKEVFELVEYNRYSAFVASRGLGKTLIETTILNTPNGNVMIKDISVGDKVYSLDENTLGLKIGRVYGKTERYKKKLFKLTTSSGRILYLSKDHPLYTINGWKRIGDGLAEGDYIATTRELPFPDKFNNVDYAVVAGLMVSEGTLNTKTAFYNQDTNLFNKLKASCNKLGIKYGRILTCSGRNKSITLNRPSFNKHFSELDGHNSHSVKVPNKIFLGTEKVMSTFLKYLFEGDGGVEKDKISYATTSRDLAHGIQSLFLHFGIHPSITQKVVRCNNKQFLSYRCIICGGDILTFHKKIGFVSKRKQDRLNRLVASLLKTTRNSNKDIIPSGVLDGVGFKRPSNKNNYTALSLSKQISKWDRLIRDNTVKGFNKKIKQKLILNYSIIERAKKYISANIFWERIMHIEDVGEQWCYDIQIGRSGDGNYIAEGIYTHNSYITFILYPIFKKFLFENMDVLICTNIPSMAKRNMRSMKRIIDSNEMLSEKKDTSNMRLLKWGDREIEYNKGMVETITLGSTPRSAHVPLVIIDDPLRDDNVYSDEYIENYILKQVIPCTGRTKGRVILNGTLQHPTDIFHKVMGDKPEFRGKLIRDGRMSYLGFMSKVFSAVEDWETKKAYLPEVYSWEDLMSMRRTMGEMSFAQEILCQVVPNKSVIFPWPLIRQCIPGNPELEQLDHGEPGKYYVIGADFASSASKTADYTAFSVLEYNPETGTKILRKLINERMTAEEQEDVLIQLARDFNNAFVMVEKNNIGEWMRQRLEAANIFVGSFTTTKQTKQNAIKFLRNELSNRRILFPPLEGPMAVLRRQLTSFGYKLSRGRHVMEALTGHDDAVDSLWIANMATQETMGSPSSAICL